MGAYEPGTRVFAIASAKDGKVFLFGNGVYEGDFPVGDTEPVGDTADLMRDQGKKGLEIKNPRIRLDGGQVVWGCECWWGPEVKFAERFRGYEVVPVDIDELRKSIQDAKKQ